MRNNRIILPVSLLLLLAFVLACAESESARQSNIVNRPPEELVVFLDSGKRPSPDDINVKRVRFLLDYLAENTTSSRSEIADNAHRTAEMIENKFGKKYPRQEILEGCRRILEAIPANKRGKKDEINTITYLLYLEASTK